MINLNIPFPVAVPLRLRENAPMDDAEKTWIRNHWYFGRDTGEIAAKVWRPVHEIAKVVAGIESMLTSVSLSEIKPGDRIGLEAHHVPDKMHTVNKVTTIERRPPAESTILLHSSKGEALISAGPGAHVFMLKAPKVQASGTVTGRLTGTATESQFPLTEPEWETVDLDQIKPGDRVRPPRSIYIMEVEGVRHWKSVHTGELRVTLTYLRDMDGRKVVRNYAGEAGQRVTREMVQPARIRMDEVRPGDVVMLPDGTDSLEVRKVQIWESLTDRLMVTLCGDRVSNGRQMAYAAGAHCTIQPERK